MAQQQMTSSQKALMLELKSLQEEPVEGFRITLVDESDLYNWEVAIFGPPNTLYEGGYFKVPPPPLPDRALPGGGLGSPPLRAVFGEPAV
jgi:ubiquitin-conjugating enzyme E2 R